MNLQKAREAYQNDPVFHQLVDVLVNQIETLQSTPSEIREIAMFACLLHKERDPRPPQYDLSRISGWHFGLQQQG